MKLFKIFKKETSKEVKNNIQKMDKKQLEKVIGGADKTNTTITNTKQTQRATFGE
ncbi:MAG: hypothetical protein U0W65_04600 [Bacteroidia bacterium]